MLSTQPNISESSQLDIQHKLGAALNQFEAIRSQTQSLIQTSKTGINESIDERIREATNSLTL